MDRTDYSINNPVYNEDDEQKVRPPAEVTVSDMGYYNPGNDTLLNPLHMDKYKTWYDILKSDDIPGYDNFMRSKTAGEKSALLNKKFLYCTPYSKELKDLRKDSEMYEFETPLCLAAGAASRRVFVRMLRDGADVLKSDIEGVNVVHAMIRACGSNENAEYMYMEMLQAVLMMYDIRVLRKLLLHEDFSGLRSLEAAAKYGAFGLFRLILETKEVYYETIDEVGICTYAGYDIDDYESGFCRKRELRSPLRFIRMLSPKNFKSFDENKICEHPVIQKWIHRKFLHAIPWIVVWFLFRLTYLVSHVMFSADLMVDRTITCGINSTHAGCGKKGAPPIKLMILLSDFSTYSSWGIIFFDLCDLMVYLFEKDRWKLQGGVMHVFKKFVSFTLFYRSCQIALAIVSLISYYYIQKASPDAVNIIKAASMPLILFGLIYMFEMFPLIGIFAITLQKMATSLIKFGMITVTVWLIYAYFFMISVDDSNFSSIGQSIYSLFLIDSGNFNFTNPGAFVMLAHITYYYLAAVLLLNYLIAAMATISDEMSKQRKMCQTMRRLDMAILIDDRFGRWFRKLFYLCRKKRERVHISVKNPMRFRRIKLQVDLDREHGILL